MTWVAVQKNLFDDPSFVTLPERCQLLYLRLMCRDADSHGRCGGHPKVMRPVVIGADERSTVEALRILHLSGLIVWYAEREADQLGRRAAYVQISHWDRDQPQRKLSKRGPSRIPPPSDNHMEAIRVFDEEDVSPIPRWEAS